MSGYKWIDLSRSEQISNELVCNIKQRLSNIHDTLAQCCFNVGPRLGRWSNVETTLCQRLALAGCTWCMGS